MFAEQHIVLRPNPENGPVEFYCHHCGAAEEAPTGLTITEYNKVSRRFIDAHRDCIQLRVFTNGTDTHVAASIEDALAVFKELMGDDYIADGYGDAGDWYEAGADDFHTIFFEDKERKDFPDGFEILEEQPGFIRVKAANKDWAKWGGRGFLCSTEY